MKTIGVVVDSTFNLPDDFLKDLNIQVVRPNIIIDGRVYTDGLDITNEEVVDAHMNGSRVTSSQPNPDAFLTAFEALRDQGYEDIVVMTVSSGVSGTHQSAVIAADMIEDLNVEVIDSKSSAMGGEIIIAEVKDDVLNGATLKEVATKMRTLVKRLEARITVDNLTALFKGGRMSRTQSVIGNLLKIKPIISVIDGKLELAGKVRTTKKVLEHIINEIKEHSPKEPLHIRIAPLGAIESAIELKELIQERFENAKVYVCKEITSVLSVHFGRGGLGVAWLG